jgi:hypothetical protein
MLVWIGEGECKTLAVPEVRMGDASCLAMNGAGIQAPETWPNVRFPSAANAVALGWSRRLIAVGPADQVDVCRVRLGGLV